MSRSEGFVERVVEILARERRQQGMPHEKLAEAAGIHRSTVSRTERGLMNPTLYVLHSMACALKLRFSEVIVEAEKVAARKSG